MVSEVGYKNEEQETIVNLKILVFCDPVSEK